MNPKFESTIEEQTGRNAGEEKPEGGLEKKVRMRKIKEEEIPLENGSIDQEIENISRKKVGAEHLIKLRQKKIELKKLIELLNEGLGEHPDKKEGEDPLKEKISNEDAFYVKTVLLPNMVAWIDKREKEGKEANLLEFIKEESLSGLELNMIVETIENYEQREESVPMTRDVMLKKGELCDTLRAQAHKILSEIGEIDPILKDVKMQQLDADFQEWFDGFIKKLETKLELWRENLGVLEKVLEKFWDGQGKIQKIFAQLNKKRMGIIEHTFMLKAISRQIESIVNSLDRSDDAREVRHYTRELKNYMRLLVEWNNEYQRLHKVGDYKKELNATIDIAYAQITAETTALDKIAIAEIYPDREGKKHQLDLVSESLAELNTELNLQKRRVCDEILSELRNRVPAIEEDFAKKERDHAQVTLAGGKAALEKQRDIKLLRERNIVKELSEITRDINNSKRIQDIVVLIDKLKSRAHTFGFESEGIARLDEFIAQALSK